CMCGDVLMGKVSSEDCPLFGKVCSPMNPQGACMVSTEGSCYQKYLAR
ncbi:MAG: hydrogenase formation protein HypD, partial [Lachnospiraceae bacterium]|nr:hydrogenase formation protein HypD [Lachnospiraceae bacterium]